MSYARIIILVIQLILLCLIGTAVKRKGYFYKGIQFGIVAYYAVFPLIIIFLYKFGGATLRSGVLSIRTLETIVNAEISRMLISSGIVILFDIFFTIAYKSKKWIAVRKTNAISIQRTVKRNICSILTRVGDICLLVGGVSTLLYTLSFGSISRALALSGYIRAFNVSVTNYISYFMSLFIIPAGMVVISPWCYLVSADYTGSTRKKVKFIITYLIGLLFLAVKAGRAPILLYIISLVMPFIIKRFKHPWVILCAGAVFCLPILDVLDRLFDGTSSSNIGYDMIRYLSQFTYPYKVLLDIFDIVKQFGLRFGQDFITSFIGLLPGLSFDSTWRIVSEYYGGANWVNTGSTPTDLVSFCILEFHIFGIILGFVLGYISRNIDLSLKAYSEASAVSSKSSKYGVLALSSFILLNAFWFVSTADFESLVRNIYFLGLCAILLISTSQKKARRKL